MGFFKKVGSFFKKPFENKIARGFATGGLSFFAEGATERHKKHISGPRKEKKKLERQRIAARDRLAVFGSTLTKVAARAPTSLSGPLAQSGPTTAKTTLLGG